MADHKEIAATDAICSALFQLFDAFPRLKDQVIDPLRATTEAAAAAAEGAGAATESPTPGADSRGALLLRGPLKQLQVVAMVTQKSKAGTTADRFKPLAARCKWVPSDAISAELANANGVEGLQERFRTYDVATQYVVVVVVEFSNGDEHCQHNTATGNPRLEDRGPWEYVLEHGGSRTGERPKFGYNGSLMPYRVSPDRPLPDHIVRPDYYATGQAEAERRSDARETPPVLNEKAAKKMRAVCKLGREILDAAHRAVRPGVTTDEIDRVVHEYTVEHNAYPAPLHYFDFPKSVCTSVNEVVCHGIPDMRELQDGDIVNVDVSAILDGYHSDLNETFVVGKNVSAEKKALIKATHDSLMKCIEACKPGVFYRDMGSIITKFVNAQGFQVDKTYCGHGIGQWFHCAPNIPHYAGNKAKFVMKKGHCFTIEPMINMGSWKDTHWPDGWTAVTKDGLPSAQFEHTLLMHETGVEILTARLPTSPPLWWEEEEGAAAASAPTVPIPDLD